LIHTSSTAGSSRYFCSAPKPDARATSSSTTAVVLDRQHHPGQAAQVVLPDHLDREAAYQGGVALRVDALTAHGRAQAGVQRLDQLAVGVGVGQGHPHLGSTGRI